MYAPGYYQLVKDHSKLGDVGDLWYLLGITGDDAHLVSGKRTVHMRVERFAKYFEFAPDGFQKRQEQMTELMSGLHQIGGRQDQLIANTEVPCLPAPADPNEIIGEVVGQEKPIYVEDEVEHEIEPEPVGQAQPTSQGLAIINGPKTPAQTATNLKVVKTNIAFTQRAIARRQSELRSLIREQEIILREKTGILTKYVEMATEAIYMLNAYLGKDEELVRIQKGKPAPADTKVVIRQLLLYMDEETAAAGEWAEKGGLDFQNIKEFDAWVRKPEHLRQVLPEDKGIVAFKPRRNDKHYSDNPFENDELNRKNRCLYLLVRNGDLLYRIYTNLWLENTLLPTKDQFEKFFYEERSYYKSEDPKPLRPGSRAYMEAMEQAAKEHRRYYTVLLLIQGILDRTKVLLPMPLERANICDLSEATKYFDFIYDAENLLGDGRPGFRDWLSNINQSVEIGCRVVGNWSRAYNYDRHSAGDDDRVWPKRARYPGNKDIYTIEKDMGSGELAFLYSREGETVYHGWRDWKGRPATNRARYSLRRDDEFFINFDAATVEEMEYYCSSRLHRHEYESMLPLMKLAIRMKIEEKKIEEPFRKLLMGQIMKEFGSSLEQAEARIDELINWWKFKNKTHRALTADDSKAVRMIVAEFGRREDLDRQQEKLSDLQGLVVEALHDDPNLLAVFHRKDNEYVSFSFKNDDSVFVREQHWTLDANDELECVYDKPWKTVDKRHESWKLLWSHARWAEWQVGASASEHLTDEEVEQGIQWGLDQFKGDSRSRLLSRDDDKGKLWGKFLAVMQSPEGKIEIWFLSHHASIPEKKFMTEDATSPGVKCLTVNWEKKPSGEVTFRWGGTQAIHVNLDTAWVSEKDPRSDYRKSARVLRVYEDNLAEARKEDAEVDVYKENKSKLLKPIRAAEEQVHDAIMEAWYKEEHIKFLEEYVDPDGSLWEEFKLDLKKPAYIWPSWLEYAAAYLIEMGESCNGMTVEAFVKRANGLGYRWGRDNSSLEKDYEWWPHIKDIVLDLSYGVDPNAKEDEDEDEGEDNFHVYSVD